MSTLEKRLETLERASQSDLGIRMIVRKIVNLERPDAEAVRCTFEGQEWHRANDESEDQMLHRVYEQVKATGRLLRVLMY